MTMPAHRGEAFRVALVNMPWVRATTPSIQCGLLKAGLTLAGYDTDVHYLNLELAAVLGADLYFSFANLESERVHLLGEWLFGCAAFGPEARADKYLDAFPEIAELVGRFGVDVDALLDLRERRLPQWIDELAGSVDWSAYGLIGFTSTFEQNVAALALARAIKARQPAARVVFGGANVDGDMGVEYFRVFEFIDFVVNGEGDIALPALVTALAGGSDPAGLPGVCTRAGATVVNRGAAPRVSDLNLVATPDYTDYFAALDRLGRDAVIGHRRVRLPAEFSRGCWWGEKHHCTFCGLNAAGMAFRSKSAVNAVNDILTLARRHQVLHIDAVDNIIDMSYLGTLCDELTASGIDVEMFFEVKANLNRQQLESLARAGIGHIQPGIESLSTHVLGLMRKGSTMPLNVRLLKWAHYHRLGITWNILMGFPGETDADYLAQAELMPTLFHLPPPSGTGRLWLERYSPYFTDSGFGIRQIQPKLAYRFAYPVPGLDLNQVAYFFDYEVDDVASVDAHQAVMSAVAEWKKRWRQRRPQLTYRRGPGYLRIRDTRATRLREEVLSGWAAAAFEGCGEAPRAPVVVSQRLAEAGHEATVAQVTEFLQWCVTERYAVSEDEKYLTVALPHVR